MLELQPVGQHSESSAVHPWSLWSLHCRVQTVIIAFICPQQPPLTHFISYHRAATNTLPVTVICR